MCEWYQGSYDSESHIEGHHPSKCALIMSDVVCKSRVYSTMGNFVGWPTLFNIDKGHSMHPIFMLSYI